VPIETLPRLPADRLVHIVGQVKAQESGRYVRIRDESGQVDVQTGQTTLCPINAQIEAVGFPAIIGTEWRLRSGLFRLDKNQATVPVVQPNRTTLRPCPAVLEMSAPEAMEGLAGLAHGVVDVGPPRQFPFFFIQDSSGGICVMRGSRPPPRTYPAGCRGAWGHLHGPVCPGGDCSRFDKVSNLSCPRPN